MIHESYHWKQPLLRTADWIAQLRITNRNRERAMVRAERDLMIGFYAVRKLLDTFKISLSTRAMTLPLKWSPCIRSVDYLNSHRIDELFNLEITNIESRDLEFLCNQFVHSYVFIIAENEDGSIAGVFISSDKVRQQKLYFVDRHQILLVMRTVGNDYPRKQHMRRNEKTLQWEETTE